MYIKYRTVSRYTVTIPSSGVGVTVVSFPAVGLTASAVGVTFSVFFFLSFLLKTPVSSSTSAATTIAAKPRMPAMNHFREIPFFLLF